MQNAAAAGLVALYFVWFAGRWISAGFTPDDLMNLHRSLEQPLWKLLLDHVTVFLPTPEYRPAGDLLYRGIYRFFGFNPLPFHVALYTLLTANIYLTYLAVHRLTGVAAAGCVAAVLHAWHGNWTGLHFSVGYCFDVLCYLFYAMALVAFCAGRLWRFFGLFVLCLNAKEVAVSLPLVCLVWKGWDCRRSATAAIAAGALTATFIGGRLMAHNGLAEIDSYAPHFDLATLFERVTAYLDMAVYGQGRLPWGLAILLAATVWSLIHHQRAAVVSIVMLVAGVLPLAFIPQRDLEAVYVPSLGAVILLALPLADLCKRQPLVATAAAILLAGTFHHVRRHRNPDDYLAEARHLANVARQMRQSAPYLPPGAHVLFLRDPFPRFEWNSLFLTRLLYNDREMIVHRPGRPGGPIETYDAVFDWDEGESVLRRRTFDTTNAITMPKDMPSK
jgi:hypothetical protein